MTEKEKVIITVFFEAKNHAEKIAEFYDEKTYSQCSPALEKIAKKQRGIITESIEEH